MRPTALLLGLLLAWSVLGALVLAGWLPMLAWWLALAVLMVLLVTDALRLRALPSPTVARQVPEALAVGVPHAVHLQVQASRPMQVTVFDLAPGAWQVDGLPRALPLRPGTRSAFQYQVLPQQRGGFQFEGVHLRLRSPWRLWQQQRHVAPMQTVRVFPNFRPLARLALFSADQASRLVGAHIKRRRGEGTDFHQMRDYRVGDSLRQVDWKATSRAGRLISREYQDEKNQQLLVVVDTGRRMMAREDGVAHFDQVLDAALVVSYLALRQGDAAGLFAIGGQTRWVPPRRSMGAIDDLLRAGHDLQPEAVATDYLAAASELSVRQRRRALVMLVTNVRDEDLEDLLAAVKLLQRRHLVCVASLREQVLDQALERPINTAVDAAEAAAAALYLEQRGQAHDALRSHGVMVLDVTADALPAALVERYLAVKREGRL